MRDFIAIHGRAEELEDREPVEMPLDVANSEAK